MKHDLNKIRRERRRVNANPHAPLIVKVQVDAAGRSMLVYNEDRSLFYQDAADDTVLVLVPPLTKRYFHATLDDNGLLEIGDEAEEQDW